MNFNKSQLKAINTMEGNTIINATAGSGKTSVLVERIKTMIDNGIYPNEILAVTFSRKAKENMENRLNKLCSSNNVSFETFHSLALRIIKAEYGDKYNVWTLQWQKEKALFEICKAYGLCSVQDDLEYNDIMKFIAMQKRNRLKSDCDLEDIIHINNLPYSDKVMKNIWIDYEEYKQSYSYIEFDDFINIVLDLFDKKEDILDLYQSKFKYVLMDEAQDVNKSQWEFISKIALANNNFFIVGDMLQSIYNFMGGSSKYMMVFDEQCNTQVINFNMNYRCSKDIVELSNTFASHLLESKHRNYIEAESNNNYYKKPEISSFSNCKEELANIINNIQRIKNENKDYTYNDFAILARTNAQLQKYQLDLSNSNIPFDIQDGKLFTEQYEIKLLLSYLKLSNNLLDNDAYEFCYNKPNRWLDKKFLEETYNKLNQANGSLYNAMFLIDRRNWKFRNGIDELAMVINALQNKRFKNVGDMIKYLRTILNIDKFVSKGKENVDGTFQQIENMDSFQNMCEEYKTVNELLFNLDRMNTEVRKNIGKDSIKLLTIHKAKGLEYKNVFIVGVNEGLLPHSKALTEEERRSEERLMYVAITRAEKELYISSTKFYNDKPVEESRFIKYLQSN